MPRNTFVRLHADEVGFVVSAEMVLVATVALLGLVAGLCSVSRDINGELTDVGNAWSSLNQSFHVSGGQCEGEGCGCSSGSQFTDHGCGDGGSGGTSSGSSSGSPINAGLGVGIGF